MEIRKKYCVIESFFIAHQADLSNSFFVVSGVSKCMGTSTGNDTRMFKWVMFFSLNGKYRRGYGKF